MRRKKPQLAVCCKLLTASIYKHYTVGFRRGGGVAPNFFFCKVRHINPFCFFACQDLISLAPLSVCFRRHCTIVTIDRWRSNFSPGQWSPHEPIVLNSGYMYLMSLTKHTNQLTNKRRQSSREDLERTVNSTYSNRTCHLLPLKLIIYISHYFQRIWYINYSTRKITSSKWGKTGVVYEKSSVHAHSFNK